MIINGIRRPAADGGARVECDVKLETGRRGSHTLFACTEPPHTLEADPNGFLLGAFLPAWLAGETRIRIEGAVCPLLAANLSLAAGTQRTWFKGLPPPPAIECDHEYRPPGTMSGAFFSGGVDSLAMLRSLTARMPPGHPDRPSAVIVADYQDMGRISRDETDSRFARSMATGRAVCGEIGLDVIPVRSNFCRLNTSARFWMQFYHVAFFASMGHFLGREFRLFYVASSYPVSHLIPWGGHPQLDPFYSSQHVRISHQGVELSRLRKVEVLRDWPAALDHLYVCVSLTSNGENCGKCEKCVRTRLQLLVAGVLANARAFPGNDVSAREIRSVHIATEYARLSFEETLPGLRRLGRHDLVAACEHAIGKFDPGKAGSAAPVIRVVRVPGNSPAA